MLQIQCTGNIGNDAKVKQLDNGVMITFSLAINQQVKNAESNEAEKVQWINCVFFRKNDVLAQYIKKGVKVFVQGELDIEMYQGAGGVFKVNANCTVSWLELLTPKPSEK